MDPVFDDDIRISNKRLLIAHPQSRSRFAALIQCLAADLPRAEPILITRRDGRQPVIINLLPLPQAGQNPLNFDSPAILSFISLEPRPCPNLSLLVNVFSFTPAEARLAAALANGASIEDAAKILSISSDTVRHQLKSVFLKTDTHRQSQLIALLASSGGPVFIQKKEDLELAAIMVGVTGTSRSVAIPIPNWVDVVAERNCF